MKPAVSRPFALLPLSLLIATSLGLSACKRSEHPSMPPVPEPKVVEPEVPVAPAIPADDNLNAVLWIQRSAEYAAVTRSLFRAAADHLDAALAEKNWDALVPDERAEGGFDKLPPAVVLDIDETVLDNSPYQARLVLDGAEFADASWDLWVAEKKAKPVPGMVEFAKAAEARGVTLIYISNRAVHLQEATLANLRAEGLPVKDDSVFLGMGLEVEGCEQAKESDKLCRRQLAGRSYRVLMQFGDQLGDFARIPENTVEGRAALSEEYRDWFGERWWMLPNPTYGSWEPAVFGNDWSQPREARRQAKRQALETAR